VSTVITVAPTGPIASKADNPALPTQPEEIADAVHQAYLAGASVAHIHLRDSRDQPTADLPLVQRSVQLAGALDRPVASVGETAALLHLPPR
jgi:3-keto-5-aminohexanoate cleavage enzyme